MILFWLLGACNSDYDVKEGSPQLELGASTVDFGAVVIYQQSTIALSIANTGMAPLEIEGVPFLEASPAYQVLQAPQTVAPNQTSEIELRFAPLQEGVQRSTIQLLSNDPERPLAEIELVGEGVQPLIEVDPLSIDFGTVPEGEARSAAVSIQASGTGTLRISDLSVEPSAFELELPQGLALPIELSSGLGLELDLRFTASDSDPISGELLISSNDPTASMVSVALGANGGGSGDNLPPTVTITSPPSGWQSALNTAIPIHAQIGDDQDAPSSIPVLIYWNSSPVGTVFADATGQIETDLSLLTSGTGPLTLRAIDSAGGIGEDSVTLSVVDPNDPMPYILSGGADLYHFWSVDDDIEIYVDGQLVFSDNNGTQDDHPPLSFMAQSGSSLRIVAIDSNYCDQALGPLTLHFGVGQSQAIWDGFCRSACEESTCYDASFSGPWPSTFVDETVQVALP